MKKVNQKAEQAAKYKKAFDQIIGDPFSYPEPTQGHYETLKTRSSVAIVQHDNETIGTANKSKPNQLDFFIDCENAVLDALVTYQNSVHYTLDELTTMFDNTYWIESGVIFNQKQRSEIEQIVGRILYARKISPVSKYFTAIRK